MPRVQLARLPPLLRKTHHQRAPKALLKSNDDKAIKTEILYTARIYLGYAQDKAWKLQVCAFKGKNIMESELIAALPELQL